MTDIQNWLKHFKSDWENKNPQKVINLFTDDVDYYETPSQKLDYPSMKKEWRSIKEQKNISLELQLFSSAERKHTVKWSLSYTKNNERTELNGVYLIKLNKEGKCTEFWQYCQLE